MPVSALSLDGGGRRRLAIVAPLLAASLFAGALGCHFVPTSVQGAAPAAVQTQPQPPSRPAPVEAPPAIPPLTPRWAYEPWVWEDEDNTAAAALTLVDDHLQRGLPVGAVLSAEC